LDKDSRNQGRLHRRKDPRVGRDGDGALYPKRMENISNIKMEKPFINKEEK